MNWKNFPQKIFSTTSTKDKFDFATKNIQLSTFMSIGKAQELDDYRGEEFEIFQTNWRRKIGYICFLWTMFYETKIVVFCSTHALCLFSQLYSPSQCGLGGLRATELSCSDV